MAANEIHLNDVGTVFVLTIKDDTVVVDISGATTKTITFAGPDGVATAKTASLTTDGTDGKMQYTTVANDLDRAGTWKIQGKVVLASGTWYTDISTFTVHGNL